MRIFKYLNKVQTSSLFPFMITSVFLAAAQLMSIAGDKINNEYEVLIFNLTQLLLTLVPYVFCFFITLMLSESKRSLKAFWSIICLAVINTAVSSFSNDNSALVSIGILVSLFCVFCYNRFDLGVSLSLTIISGIIFGILLGFIFDYRNTALMWYSQLISGKGVFSSIAFSVFDTVLSLFGEDSLKDMFFYKSYGGSLLIDGDIVTGVKDLFETGYSSDLLSNYMSGHYFVMFAVIGMMLSLAGELKGVQRLALIITGVGAVISGNFTLFFIFIFLESPFLFLSSVLISALSYAAAFVLKLNIGYLHGGGIIEMIIYGDKWVYLLAGGVVFVAIGYFIFKFSIEKRGISDSENIYIPTRLNSLVKALGGVNNILRFRDGSLEVRNPKLINTIELNCEIDENVIISDDERLKELKDYI